MYKNEGRSLCEETLSENTKNGKRLNKHICHQIVIWLTREHSHSFLIQLSVFWCSYLVPIHFVPTPGV